MTIGVIGAGVSGITFALKRKMLHPNDEVIVFEHTDKALKKILSTGNGKCNIGNETPLENAQNDRIANLILNEYDFFAQKEFLNSLHIRLKMVSNLAYPITESAVTVRNAFLKAALSNNVKILLETNVKDYVKQGSQIKVITDKGDYLVDKLVISTGGKSLPKSGSDGSFINILNKHNYSLKEFSPALCPIYTKEKTKLLDGTRVKAEVSVLDNNQEIFKERGELLFKEHGLSGIVIFNASRIISKDTSKSYKVVIDLLPDVEKKELEQFIKDNGQSALLETYLHPNIAKFIEGLNIKDAGVINTIKHLTFTFDKLYGFEVAQISVGGIQFQDVNDNLESKKEPNVHFIGEILDYDAPCGGYNLMWAIGSALYLAKAI